jgi:hypothetical protein
MACVKKLDKLGANRDHRGLDFKFK